MGINIYAVNMPESPSGGSRPGDGSEGGSAGVAAYLATEYVHQITI
jgi:succinate-semialdehyde dehydrogenase/glutarate-semialdehyde dehydrogenase